MPSKDARIDVYISKSADFAQPILNHLREVIHKACPEVKETIKWNFPHFEYKDEILCSFAAFKGHCSFTFWKASIMQDPENILLLMGETGMGNFGRITSLSELPPDIILITYIKQATKLNEEGIKPAAKKKSPRDRDIETPADLEAALKQNTKAFNIFTSFSYSHKKEYIEWINEAKRPETRSRRIRQTIEWVSEGKGRNWKYEK